MKKLMMKLMLGIALTIGCALAAWATLAHISSVAVSTKALAAISSDEAGRIATRECEAKGIDVSKSKLKTELRSNLWIVTFPTNLAAGVFGSDYLAQVYLNAETGKIERFMVG